MLEFEQETGKNAIYNGKITGSFEYWLWMEDRRSKGLARKKRGTAKPIKKPKTRVEVLHVKFTPKQLSILTERHKKKLDAKGYNQIKSYLRKLEGKESKSLHPTYKEKIIEIFDIYKVPYNKKYISKRIELK